jgi:hypothetical protein
MTLKEFLKQCTPQQRWQMWGGDYSKGDQGNRSTRQYIYAISNGTRRPSPARAKEIERLTGGKVTRSDLRPDLWGD